MGSLRSLGLCLLVFLIRSCSCLAEYEIFPGFYNNENETTTETMTSSLTTAKAESNSSENKNPITTAKSTTANKTTPESPSNDSSYKPFICPEEETPLNIGPYEVPTQKDLAIHMKKTLLRIFKSYHQKALHFLKDITQATRATSVAEKNCPVQMKRTYKQCVRYVSNQCQVITKSLVTSLERQRHDVSAFTEASICNVSAMRADPVQLIKTIAMEDASLEFALPGFLRLLGACSVYCQQFTKSQNVAHWRKPNRHMTDQDLVIKHFLTRKNYTQLIKGNL